MSTMVQEAMNTNRQILMPAVLLKLECAAFVIAGLALYTHIGGNWLLFALLILAPDLSMLGYLVDIHVGSIVYNTFHIVVGPILLGALSLAAGSGLGVQIALIWFIHIAADRVAGYGLKYATAFKDTHLGRI